MPLLRHLDNRAQRYFNRTGVSPFMIGELNDLHTLTAVAPQLRPRFHTVLAQPGLSIAATTISACSPAQSRTSTPWHVEPSASTAACNRQSRRHFE
ncbi:hypothetical protein [Kutzneria sp. CA-103260]|uniref:hypothetical protein n=1 Tax=Kutzneria sp. CA-103260 TaxID=2802641 RepID=UPI001BA6847D|nr:hypothetical protein [Kutzneria sp. CA-103260]